MKKVLFSLIFFIIAVFGNAQAPYFQWAKSMGGASSDWGNSIAVDTLGNVYTTGYHYGSGDFDPGVGIFNLTPTGVYANTFISKLDASGNFIWAKNIGGSGTSQAVAFSSSLDVAGNIYLTGRLDGTADFDPGVGVFDLTAPTTYDDIFISKLDDSGNLIWAKKFQETSISSSTGYSIVLDKFDNIFITGYFSGTIDFDPGVGTFNLTSTTPYVNDIFITKLNASGNFVWARSIGGVGDDIGNSIAVDVAGNVYTTGYFSGTADFDPGIAVVNLTSVGGKDIFVSKLDSLGNFDWAKSMGSVSDDIGNSIIIDKSDNVYFTGSFQNTVDFDPSSGIINLTSAGNADIFISKFDSTGNFVWAKNMGGISDDFAYSITLDATNNVYTTGSFSGTIDFDPGSGVTNLTSVSFDDIFISKLDSLGNFVWAGNMGGGLTHNYGNSIAVDAMENIYTTGNYSGTGDFDPGVGVDSLTANPGSNDVFVQKLGKLPLGINEYTDDNNITIYPNPTNGIFNVVISGETKSATIEIYNSIGEFIYSKQNITAQTQIELSNQANGLYFVKVMSDGKIVGSKKIVKE